MKQLLRMLLGIIPMFLLSCDYSPSGSHYEEIDPNPEVIADISLDDFLDQDTLRLRGTLNIKLSLSFPGRKVYYYELFVGSRSLGTGNSNHGSIQLNTRAYADGYHRMRLWVVANSGTGSLADKAGAEGVEVYKDWVIYIDNKPPKPIALKDIKAQDGQLKLEWEKYNGSGFLKYEIYRQLQGQNNEIVATITNPNQATWIDESYLGGSATYRVATSLNGLITALWSEPLHFFYPKPHVLSSALTDDNQLRIVFSSTPFYRNLGKYEFTLNFYTTIAITNSQDTVLTIPATVFGDDFHATLATYPKTYPTANTWSLDDRTVLPALGAPWGPHEIDNLTARPTSGKFYFADYGYIKVVEAGTGQVLRQREIKYRQLGNAKQEAISQDGKLMYAILDNSIHKLDPATLHTLESYQLHDLLPDEHYIFSDLDGVSNTNRLILRARNAENYSDKDYAYVIDMTQKKLLTFIESDLNYGYSTISPDGRTINVSDKVYVQQSGDNWKKLPLTTREANTLKYHATSPLFFTAQATAIYFYSTTNGALEKTIRTEKELQNTDIDPITGNIYGSNQDQLYIYSGSGQLLRQLGIMNESRVFLYDNTLYSDTRFLKL